MVILDYAEANHDFLVATPLGLLELIQFQSRFYAIRQAYRQLQEAIKTCRQDIENGFISIVVNCGDHAEVWAQIAPDLVIKPKSMPQQTATPVQGLSFRGRQVMIATETITAPQQIIYRGQHLQISPTKKVAGQLPDTLYYRGAKLNSPHS
ncbi:MAG: hypothetical protein NW237_02430 [Cyanobacteriota bacterium]|nr:hypothetical protein [Cyanobacteriota bacterium]